MTNGSLTCDIPVLEPDDDFVDRLAGLAAASRPSRGGVLVPVAFGGPASRAVVIAATVAAVTAGAAAAATHLSHGHHDSPAPPGSSVGIQRPDASTIERHGATAPLSRQHETSGNAGTQTHHTPGGTTDQAPSTSDPAGPVQHGPGSSTPTGTDQGNDQGNDQGDDDGTDQVGQDQDGSGDDSNGTGQGDDGDTGGGDDGVADDGSSTGGRQDDGGNHAGSDDG